MAKAPINPSEKARQNVDRLITNFCKNSGTTVHPEPGVTEGVAIGLAHHIDTLGRPLCPCRYYPDKTEEIKHRTWICPCDDMNVYKYCHCLLFVTAEGLPITEYLPEDHEGRTTYGLVQDPTPDKGRSLRHKAADREIERQARKS